MKYYKVVTDQLKSLGLRKNPNIMQFETDVPKREPFPVKGKGDAGGIWVANGLGNANTLKKYMLNKHGVPCRVFECEIGNILYQNSYRVKTDCVTLRKEVTNKRKVVDDLVIVSAFVVGLSVGFY